PSAFAPVRSGIQADLAGVSPGAAPFVAKIDAGRRSAIIELVDVPTDNPVRALARLATQKLAQPGVSDIAQSQFLVRSQTGDRIDAVITRSGLKFGIVWLLTAETDRIAGLAFIAAGDSLPTYFFDIADMTYGLEKQQP